MILTVYWFTLHSFYFRGFLTGLAGGRAGLHVDNVHHKTLEASSRRQQEPNRGCSSRFHSDGDAPARLLACRVLARCTITHLSHDSCERKEPVSLALRPPAPTFDAQDVSRPLECPRPSVLAWETQTEPFYAGVA